MGILTEIQSTFIYNQLKLIIVTQHVHYCVQKIQHNYYNGYNLSTDDISPEPMLQQLLKEDLIMAYQRYLAYTST